QMVRHATDVIRNSSLAADAKSRALDQLHASAVGFVPPQSLTRAIENAVASGARPALLFASAVVSAGALLSFLIPHVDPTVPKEAEFAESFVLDEPLDIEPSLID